MVPLAVSNVPGDGGIPVGPTFVTIFVVVFVLVGIFVVTMLIRRRK